MEVKLRGDLITYLRCNGPTCIAQLAQKDALLSASRIRPLKWRTFVNQEVPEIEIVERVGEPIMLMLRGPLDLSRFAPMFARISQVLGIDVTTSTWLLETYISQPAQVVRYAWVGDAALSAYVAARLSERHPTASIGELTDLRKRYTANECLAAVLGGQELSCVPKQGQANWHREGTYVEALLERTLKFREYCELVEKCPTLSGAL